MDAPAQRARQRAGWTICVRRLGDQYRAEMAGSVEARLRAVDQLTADGWRLAGKTMPAYRRSETPIRVLSLGDAVVAPR